MNYVFSINGRTIEAVARRRCGEWEIKTNFNKIMDAHDTKLQINPLDKILDHETYIHSLITYFVAVELHEFGHVYNFDIGCSSENHKDNHECPWCHEVEKIYWWLL